MFVVFDIETTGLNSKTDDIIQFAYIMFDNRNMKVQAETLYFYYDWMSWSEEAYAVHHIPMNLLEQYKDKFEENLVKMFTVLYGANVCGFNNRAFDCPYVYHWLTRMGIPNLEYRTIQDCMTEWYPFHHRQRIKLVKLTEMAGMTPEVVNKMAQRWFGTQSELAAHDATYDTTATALLTLQGINKGYISFDMQYAKPATTKVDIVDSGADKVQELLSTPNSGKVRDPRGFAVRLQMSDSEDDVVWHYVTTDKSKYFSDDCTQSEVDTLRLNGKVRDDIYVATEDPTVFLCHTAERTLKIIVGEHADSQSAARNGSSYFVQFL